MKKIDAFKKRYTVRMYDSRPVSDELLTQLIDAASHAPNTGNMQWYSVVVTRDPQRKAELAPLHFNQPSVTTAPAVLTFCIDLLRFETWCRLGNATPGFENFQSFIAAIIDTSVFAQQFCCAAESIGLGTCYLGTTAYNAPRIAELLELPRRVVPVISVTVGYPQMAGHPAWRLPVKAIMHSETYRTMTDPEVKEAYLPLDNAVESERFIAENNTKTLAQVFTDVRYPRESAEYYSKIYGDMLADNNFISSKR